MFKNRQLPVSTGDINAFFGLMGDNMSDLVIMAGILISVFHFPPQIVLYKMIPGSAVGVFVGDIIYSWMAVRLSRKTGRKNVTAMPLGFDTPSTFALTFGVIGPAYITTNNATLAWEIAMAVVITMGTVKFMGAWCGEWIRRIVPRSALLGSIAAVALLLIAFLPSLEVFANPITGFLSLGIILMTLVAKIRLPMKFPGALAAVLAGTAIYYILSTSGITSQDSISLSSQVHTGIYIPWPTMKFINGISYLPQYLPVAIPFAIAIIIGSVDVTESAAVAGDEYSTRDIILADSAATILSGLFGGVIQSTPYIGHPAYKDMGGKTGYTFATALFIGAGAVIGYLSFFVNILPKAAVAPILIFIGMEITAQAFETTPARHTKSIALAFIPVTAYLILIEINSVISNLGKKASSLTGGTANVYHAILLLGNGFIISSMIWAAVTALIIDHKLRTASLYMYAASILSLFGIIHSPLQDGGLFLPWSVSSRMPLIFCIAYFGTALMLNCVSLSSKRIDTQVML